MTVPKSKSQTHSPPTLSFLPANSKSKTCLPKRGTWIGFLSGSQNNHPRCTTLKWSSNMSIQPVNVPGSCTSGRGGCGTHRKHGCSPGRVASRRNSPTLVAQKSLLPSWLNAVPHSSASSESTPLEAPRCLATLRAGQRIQRVHLAESILSLVGPRRFRGRFARNAFSDRNACATPYEPFEGALGGLGTRLRDLHFCHSWRA